MKNKYFLRESYTTVEKKDRISSSKINPGVEEFRSVLQEFGFEPEDFSNHNKSNFFNRLGQELDDENYDEFVSRLFEEVGKNGDKFNLQMIELPPERNYDSVAESAVSHEGSRLDETIDGISNVIMLNRCDTDAQYPSLVFRTPEEIEEVEADEELPIIIRDSDGNIEAEYSEGYRVEAPKENYIEARVYPSANIIVVSNSGITTGIQKDIARFVIAQGESIEENQREVGYDEE
jgi:hypothetical protein